jgi:hypothetical protein
LDQSSGAPRRSCVGRESGMSIKEPVHAHGTHGEVGLW